MYRITVGKNLWRRLLAMVGCAAVLCGVLLGASGVLDGARATAAAARGNTVKSAEDMADFLLGYGVEADAGTAQVLQVTIPKKFDNSFKAFNEVIGSIGMDLTKYKGKMVEKWVLQSPNRTVEDQTAYAVLLVKNDRVIGGYLLYQPSGEVISLRDKLDVQTLAPQPSPEELAELECAAETGEAPQPTAAEPSAGLPEGTETGQQVAAIEEAAAAEEAPAEQTAAGAEVETDDGFPTD